MEKQSKEELQEEARKRAEAERERKEEARKQLEKDTAKHAWLADGGDEEGFERHWPEMERKRHARNVEEAADVARENHFSRTRSVF